jgi:hypothetical protein
VPPPAEKWPPSIHIRGVLQVAESAPAAPSCRSTRRGQGVGAAFAKIVFVDEAGIEDRTPGRQRAMPSSSKPRSLLQLVACLDEEAGKGDPKARRREDPQVTVCRA